jgi:7-cyano-7-deazaguanine synthase
MGAVVLVSGGIDSSLISVIMHEQGFEIFPLFVDYGQLAKDKELASCRDVHKKLHLPKPEVIRVPGFGRTIPCGLTNSSLDVNIDAFLPNRNLLFLVLAASYAYTKQAGTVAIGFVDEKSHLFPDQTKIFIRKTSSLISLSLGYPISIVAPLIDTPKSAVIQLAKSKGINRTYSCHTGNARPCGKCISCIEIEKSKQ